MKKSKGGEKVSPSTKLTEHTSGPHKEYTQTHAPAINAFVRTTKLLQEEAWIREWETKNANRRGSE